MIVRNAALQRAITSGECLDLKSIGTIPETWNGPGGGDVYEIPEYNPDKRYGHSGLNKWAWSIGRRKEDGKVFVALDGRLAHNGLFECLFTR